MYLQACPRKIFHGFIFSELTKKLELAKCLTKESLDICEHIFLDTGNSDHENNMNQWFNNVSMYCLLYNCSLLFSYIGIKCNVLMKDFNDQTRILTGVILTITHPVGRLEPSTPIAKIK